MHHLSGVVRVQFFQGNLESDWSPSFFNLEVERLLEGLSGAVRLDEYKFHCERGYGSVYFNQVARGLCSGIRSSLFSHFKCNRRTL